VVAHEAGHLAARDNLKGLLMAFSMDLLAWSGPGLELEWRAASEAAADQAATSDARAPRGLLLASALVKVARLAPSSARLAWPVPALHDGEELAARVRRLLRWSSASSEAAAPAASPFPHVTAGAALLAFAAAFLPAGLRIVHSALEILVRSLL
jgi:beta-lactamase regulating signal transducer with metallopeptidase domain